MRACSWQQLRIEEVSPDGDNFITKVSRLFKPLPFDFASELLFTIWMAGGPASHPCEDDIIKSKDDSGGVLQSCHDLQCHLCTLVSNADLQ
jgi:hypothetical protein